MPIYEFKCKKCHIVFDKLAKTGQINFRCPECSSNNIIKIPSAVSSGKFRKDCTSCNNCHGCKN